MNVGTVCSRRVVSVPASATLAQVAALMRHEQVGAIIVTSSAPGSARPKVAGIITDRDIVRTQLQLTADLSRVSAGQAMTSAPLVLHRDDSLSGAIAHLRVRGVRRAPVVDGEDAPIGLISVDDLLAHLAQTLVKVAGIVAAQRGSVS